MMNCTWGVLNLTLWMKTLTWAILSPYFFTDIFGNQLISIIRDVKQTTFCISVLQLMFLKCSVCQRSFELLGSSSVRRSHLSQSNNNFPFVSHMMTAECVRVSHQRLKSSYLRPRQAHLYSIPQTQRLVLCTRQRTALEQRLKHNEEDNKLKNIQKIIDYYCNCPIDVWNHYFRI